MEEYSRKFEFIGCTRAHAHTTYRKSSNKPPRQLIYFWQFLTNKIQQKNTVLKLYNQVVIVLTCFLDVILMLMWQSWAKTYFDPGCSFKKGAYSK